MRNLSLRILLSAVICIGMSGTVVADMSDVMQRFKEQHPDALFYGAEFYEHEDFFDEVGTSSMIYGTVLATGKTPLDSAWKNVNELHDLLGQEIGELVHLGVQPYLLKY